jgi:hypothetical protein
MKRGGVYAASVPAHARAGSIAHGVALDGFIRRWSGLPEARTLYRGEPRHPGDPLPPTTVGDLVHFPAFISTTASLGEAFSFAEGDPEKPLVCQVIYTVEAPKGHPALALQDFNEHLDQEDDEDEVILPSGWFRITASRVDPPVNGSGGDIRLTLAPCPPPTTPVLSRLT